MTARWLKKLEGIDQVGPSDEVYERAKGGPTLPEPQSPMQRTSTRVVTAIAAFVVFALAISLFAIPTLRLHGGSSALSAGGQLLPLWPARTTEEVQTLQAEADAGQADWALDPRQVATRFGQAVLGWPDAWAGGVSSFDPTCGVVPGTYPNTASPEIPCANAAGSDPFAGVRGAGSGTGMAGCDPAFLLCGQATGSDPSTGTQSPFLSLSVAVCDPSSCHAAPTETVGLFQPIGTGDGRLWAVFEASSPSIDLGVSPGQTVREGSSVSTGARIRTGEQFGFGIHVGASGSCGFDKATDVYHSPGSTAGTTSAGSEIVTDFGPLSATSCQRSEPGYVFAATGGKPIVLDGVAFDPLQPGGASLYALSAVPITFEWPDAAASSISPTLGTTTGWTTYTDLLGWTIDVPTTWVVHKIDGQDATSTYAGAAFGSAAPQQAPGGPQTLEAPPGEVLLELYHSVCTVCQGPGPREPQDDSIFPLTFKELAPVVNGYQLDIQGDTLSYTLAIRVGGNAPTAEQQQILDRMVASLRFQPWQFGETRNGWTALHATTEDDQKQQDAQISWQRCDPKGCYVLVYGGDAPYLLGPIQPCGEGESMTADPSSTFSIVLVCPDGSKEAWGAPGEPAPTNSTGYGAPLDVHPVIRAWDGTLLGAFGVTTSQVPAFPTPTPSP